MKTSTLHRVTVNIVCIGNNGRELCYQFNALTHQVIATDIIRIWIKSVHFEHTTSQNIHDIATLQLNNVGNCTVIERHIVVQKFLKCLQFLLIRQLTREQEEGNLLKTEALFLQKWAYQIIQLIATIVKFTLCRGQLAICIALITHDITYIGQSNQYTRTILITKSTLYIKLLECLFINLA